MIFFNSGFRQKSTIFSVLFTSCFFGPFASAATFEQAKQAIVEGKSAQLEAYLSEGIADEAAHSGEKSLLDFALDNRELKPVHFQHYEKGYLVNKDRYSTIRSFEIVEKLLRHGKYSPSFSQGEDQRIFTMMAENGYWDHKNKDYWWKGEKDFWTWVHPIADLVVARGGDLHRKTAKGETYYDLITSLPDTYWMAKNSSHSDVKFAQYLAHHGVDVKASLDGGASTLVRAIRADHLKMVEFLLGQGVNPNKEVKAKKENSRREEITSPFRSGILKGPPVLKAVYNKMGRPTLGPSALREVAEMNFDSLRYFLAQGHKLGPTLPGEESILCPQLKQLSNSLASGGSNENRALENIHLLLENGFPVSEFKSCKSLAAAQPNLLLDLFGSYGRLSNNGAQPKEKQTSDFKAALSYLLATESFLLTQKNEQGRSILHLLAAEAAKGKSHPLFDFLAEQPHFLDKLRVTEKLTGEDFKLLENTPHHEKLVKYMKSRHAQVDECLGQDHSTPETISRLIHSFENPAFKFQDGYSPVIE